MVARIEIRAVSETGFGIVGANLDVKYSKAMRFGKLVNQSVNWVASRVALSQVSIIQVSWRTDSGEYRAFTIDPHRNLVSFPAVN